MFANGRGYKIVGDYGAQPYQPIITLPAMYTLGKPLNPMFYEPLLASRALLMIINFLNNI